MKHFIFSSIALCMAILVQSPVFAAGDNTTLTPTEDTESTYTPTQFSNGSFATIPWINYVNSNGDTIKTSTGAGSQDFTYNNKPLPNGVDGGWNTTATTAGKEGRLIEWSETWGKSAYGYGGSDAFAELNAEQPSTLYQDVTTNSNDIIRWSLKHGKRTNDSHAPSTQSMSVQIGAPAGEASGVGEDINTNLKPETKVIYKHDGVTNPTGKTIGYGSTNLSNLRLTGSSGWNDVNGVYVVPLGQTVTRYAMIADDGITIGNLLTCATFTTLLGNLMITAEADGTVVLRGYWGETDNNKLLQVGIGDDTYQVNMSSVQSKNFKITIPQSVLGTAEEVSVWHPDYVFTKQTVTLKHEIADEPADKTQWAAYVTTVVNTLTTWNTNVAFDLDVKRSFVGGIYNTLCLPFNTTKAAIETAFGCSTEVMKFNGATVSGTQSNYKLDFNISDYGTEEIAAGTPFLVKPTTDVTNPKFAQVKVTYTAANGLTLCSGEDVEYVGVIAPRDIATEFTSNPNYLGITKNGTLAWADATKSTGYMRGFRGIFHVTVSNDAQSPVRTGMPARFVVSQSNTPTYINNVGEQKTQMIKIFENQQLIIIKDGVKYNAFGVKL